MGDSFFDGFHAGWFLPLFSGPGKTGGFCEPGHPGAFQVRG